MSEHEKDYNVTNTEAPKDHGIREIVEQKGAHIGEAAAIYGDVATAEQYG